MDLHSKFGQGKEEIAPKEGFLHRQYDFTQVKGKLVEEEAAIDGGSTGTRIILMDATEVDNYASFLEEDAEWAIPSTSFLVSPRVELEPASELLYGQMDSTIMNLGTHPSPVVGGKVRVIRGSKTLAVQSSENRIDSSGFKIQDPTFFYNIIDALGYSTIAKYSGALPEKVEVSLGLSLPPGELSRAQLKNFEEELKLYRWVHNDSGVAIEFEIKVIHILTEPEADVMAFYAMHDEPTPHVVLHINGGGRSIGTAILENGKPVPGGSLPIMFGGTELLGLVEQFSRAKTGGRPLKRRALEVAIRTGMLQFGNGTIDIVEEIIEAKNEQARQIANEIKSKLFTGQARYAASDINWITFSGGIFEDGEYDYSMANGMMDQLKNIAPSAQFETYDGSYITQGLFLHLRNMLNKAKAAAARAAASAEVAATTTQAPPTPAVESSIDMEPEAE